GTAVPGSRGRGPGSVVPPPGPGNAGQRGGDGGRAGPDRPGGPGRRRDHRPQPGSAVRVGPGRHPRLRRPGRRGPGPGRARRPPAAERPEAGGGGAGPVEVTRTAKGLRARTAEARAMRKPVGFVPTMGFFHQGHRSLMRRARAERGFLVVSIFVNPLQFGPGEDFEAYPRDPDRDLATAEAEGVDLVFAPDVDEMYPGGLPDVTVDPGPLGERLEGASRPGHFRGVATVVAKLFHLVGPSTAYFGEKDAQQLAVIRRMVRDLSFPVEVVGCPIVREPDGLAMSSRNVYLADEERRAARCLSLGL